jgi:hypothetical protein
MNQINKICSCSPYRAEPSRIRDCDIEIKDYTMIDFEEKININIVIDGDNFNHSVLFKLLEWFEKNIYGEILCILSPNHYSGLILNRFGDYYKSLLKYYLEKGNIKIINPKNYWNPSNGSEDAVVIYYAKNCGYLAISNDTYKNKRNEVHEYIHEIRNVLISVEIKENELIFTHNNITSNDVIKSCMNNIISPSCSLSFENRCIKALINHIIVNLRNEINSQNKTLEAYNKRMESYQNNLELAIQYNNDEKITYYTQKMEKYVKNSQKQIENANYMIDKCKNDLEKKNLEYDLFIQSL